jgi:competence transcription factor ComK
VENSFLEAGSELNGALKSSRHILKRKCNVPAALSVSHNIILIQCKAASILEGTVWIVAKHIVSIELYEINQTLIHTTGGHTLIVDMKPSKLQTIRNLATVFVKIIVAFSLFTSVLNLRGMVLPRVAWWPSHQRTEDLLFFDEKGKGSSSLSQ